MSDSLRELFAEVCRMHPDVMEPYMIRIEGLTGAEEIEMMRMALRETTDQRYGWLTKGAAE